MWNAIQAGKCEAGQRSIQVIRSVGPFGTGVEELAMFQIVDGHIVKQHSQGGPIER